MRRPLEGSQVISVQRAVAAPLCSCPLPETGALAPKIELPVRDFFTRVLDEAQRSGRVPAFSERTAAIHGEFGR